VVILEEMKNRLVFVDLLRGWAAIVMIEVHVFNAFIIPATKDEGWFGILNFVNGLVAPAFLFVSGFVFVFVSERKLEDFRDFGKGFWKQLSRIGLIWVVGYALHLPYFSLRRTLNETTTLGWLKFSQVDILHCIAVGLLILFFARIYVKRSEAFQWFLLMLGAAVVLIAPLIWEADFVLRLPSALAAYVNGQHFSQFPMFNWLGFMMFGGFTAMAFVKARNAGREMAFLRAASYVSGGLIVGGLLLIELPVRLPYVSTAIRANPLFFGTRLGIVLLLMLVCWYYAERRKTERSLVLDVSKESLLVYAAHLMVVYGEFWDGKSLASLYGKTFTIVQCAMATAGLIFVMILFAKLWSWLKIRSFPTARLVSYATGISFIILFLFRKA